MGRLDTWGAAITGSQLRIAATVVTSFLLTATAKYGIVGVLLYLHVSKTYLRVQDALLTGALSAFFVWALLLATAARRHYIRERIRTVANLNHELRNALEIILGSDYLPESKQSAAILASAERINRSLDELLRDTGFPPTSFRR